METFDNGNARPISLGDRHTPILDGDIYCSPACGYGCKKVDFDQACASAQAIADRLGQGWAPRIWENCGWHFSVEKGIASVTLDEELRYVGVFMFEMSQTNRVWMEKKGDDPLSVIAELRIELQDRIAVLKRAMLSVSSDPTELDAMSETAFIER